MKEEILGKKYSPITVIMSKMSTCTVTDIMVVYLNPKKKLKESYFKNRDTGRKI